MASKAKGGEGAAEPARTTELKPAEVGEHALLRRFRLTVVEGPDKGASCESSGARAVVGTHETATLLLSDRTVSRFHCEVSLGEGQARVCDLGSRNGTWVDGVAVLDAHLREGSVISLGRTSIRFDGGEEREKVALSGRDRFGKMVGSSSTMRAVFSSLEAAARSEATVLLEGETGTGKELAAEALHRESARRDGPLIVVDCGAVPSELLESELFGHERGAFTGAEAARRGAFESADGGTLFLDEIGELSADLQPKLLRALESREVKRVGSDTWLPVNFRLIAATNRNLRGEVNAGRFRPDLYYRLAVLEIRLPPLRERKEDLPAIVEELLLSLGAAGRPEAAPLRTPAFVAQLARSNWPGNVRELRNCVERCLVLRSYQIPASAPAKPGEGPDPTLSLKQAREQFERSYLQVLLESCQGNVSAAARAAGVDRIHFYRLLWRHGLK